MSTKKLRAFIISTFFIISIFASALVFAQQATTTETVIANINVSDAMILPKESDGNTRVSFTIINNGQHAQSDIRFGLDIIKKANKRQTIVDSFVSDQTLTLGAGESSKQEIKYIAPTFLSGDYEIWVISKTTSGLMLGLSMAGTTTFSASSSYVEIIPGSCSIQVTGDEKSYSLYQGVDVAKEEDLSFSCSVYNHSTVSLVITPSFDTYRRSMYGERVQVGATTPQEITLSPKKKTTVSFVVPKAILPQAYDVSLSLKEKISQSIISNKVVAHYVLRGASATIQNALLDKTIYKKGEIVTAQLFWTPSADSFPGSRVGNGTEIPAVTVKMEVFNDAGVPCFDPIKKLVATKGAGVILKATTNVACKSPQAVISILDEVGNVLDTRTFSSPKETSPATPYWNIKIILVSVIALSLFLSAVVIFRKITTLRSDILPASSAVKSLLFVMLISSSIFMGVGEVKAVSFTGGEWEPLTFTVNANKSVYSPGEIVNLNSATFWSGCANDQIEYTINLNLNGSTSNLGWQIGGGETVYESTSLVAPTTPGSYVISVAGCQYTYCGYGSIPITVVGPTVNLYFSFLEKIKSSFLENIFAVIKPIMLQESAFAETIK